MEKTLKRLQPAMMKALRVRYGEAEANDRWTGLESQFSRWLREEGDLGGRKNMMSSNMMLCYAVCAFYEAMDRELTREQFDMMVEDAMEASFRRMGIINMNRLYRNRTLMKLCHSFVQRYTKKVGKFRGNEWGDTWKIRVNPNGHTVGFAMTLDSCPLYEFAKKRGYMDVLPWMCATDQRVARAMHAHLIRHKTISSGDDCCEYWYVGDTSPEALADSGSK